MTAPVPAFTHYVLMMKAAVPLTLAVLTLAMTLPSAASAQSKVAAAFGNTVLTIDPDGRSRKIWLKPDGSWTGLSRRGLDLAGSWTAEGDKVCLKQSKPRLPGSLCNKFPTEVGASVQVKDPSGKSVQVKLVKGRVTK